MWPRPAAQRGRRCRCRLHYRQCRQAICSAGCCPQRCGPLRPRMELFGFRRAEHVRRAAGVRGASAQGGEAGRRNGDDERVQRWLDNMRDPSLRAAFILGFCILFAFIGTFTYVNFLLVRQPFELGMMGLGFVYFVFLPSIVTTPLAGPVARKYGARLTGAAALIIGRTRPAAAVAANVCRPSCWPRAGQRRDILCASSRHRLCRPRGASRPRSGERHVSRELFLRRSHWQCGARADIRPARLDRMCRRHRAGTVSSASP